MYQTETQCWEDGNMEAQMGREFPHLPSHVIASLASYQYHEITADETSQATRVWLNGHAN
jgi:hypothetical protein